MSKDINKIFEIELLTTNTRTKHTSFSCFKGESVIFNIFIVDYDMTSYDYSGANIKVYYTNLKRTNKQQEGFDVTNAKSGLLKIKVEKDCLDLGVNTVKVVIFDSDQEINLQPFNIKCIDNGIV